MKFTTILILSSIVLLSCKSSKEQHIYNFDKEIHLNHEKEIVISESFINLFNIYVVDSTLILKCNDQDKDIINLFNIETGKKTASFLKNGRGPNEMLWVKDVQFNGTNRQLDVYDNATKRVVRFSLDSILKGIYIPSKETKVSFRNYFAITASDSITIGQGTDENTILGVYKQDSLIQSFLKFPDNIPFFEAQSLAYQGLIRTNNAAQKFVYASFNSNLLSIFTLNNNKATIDTVLYSYLPRYEDNSQDDSYSIKPIDDVPLGFSYISVTNDYIYALYLGKTQKSHPESFFQSNQIYVLDWEGNCVSKIILDKEIWSFCVDKNNQLIYAIEINYQTENPDAKIYQYRINND